MVQTGNEHGGLVGAPESFVDRRYAFSLTVALQCAITFGSFFDPCERDWWTSLRRSTLMRHQLTFVKSPQMKVRILHAAERNGNVGGAIVSALKNSCSSGLHAALTEVRWTWRVSKLQKSLRDTFWILISFASETDPQACGAI
jgi:hypothetical protein